jgi:hypothetical protein
VGQLRQLVGLSRQLLYVVGKQPRDGVSGLKMLNMIFKNGGGECVRLRYFARNNEIANSTFQGCGVHDFKFGADGKNAEAVYIGDLQLHPPAIGDERGRPGGKKPSLHAFSLRECLIRRG